MNHRKLFSILSTFSREEMTEFSRYVSSPYFNQNENVIKLFNNIKPFHPHYITEKISNENLHTEIYPGVKVNTGSINNLITKLISHVEGFLSLRELSEEASAPEYYLLKQFERRKLDSLFKNTLKQLKTGIEQTQIHDEKYYNEMYMLNELEILFSRNRKPLGKLKTEFNKVPLSNQYLLNNCFLKIFYDHIMLLDAEQHIKLDDCNMWVKKTAANILKNAKTVPYNLLMDIYTRTMGFAEFKENYDFDETINLIFDNKDNLPDDKLKFILSPLYNYCKEKEFAGDKSFGLKSLRIIKLMAEKNLIVNNDGSLSDHEYVNFASAAVREKEYDWAEDFTNSYKKYLPVSRREDAYNYNLAVINYIHGCDEYVRKYFDSALEYLSKVNASDFYYKTRIFLLSMNIFYEIQETDTLISLIDSFKHYLSAHKNEIPPDLEERYLNFSNFLVRLVNLSERPKLTTGLKLKKDILAKKRVEFKKRLLSKVEEIISKVD